MNLRTRIAVLVGATVLVATLIGGLGTAISSRSVGRDRVDRALVDDSLSFAGVRPRLDTILRFEFDARQATCEDNDTEPLGDNPTPRELGRRRLQFLPEFASNMQLVGPNGTVRAACQALPVTSADTAIASSGEGTNFRTATIEGERFRIYTKGYEDLGAVQYARSLEITDDTLRGLLLRSLMFGLLGAILGGTLGWLFAKRLTEPVKQLSAAAQRVAQTQDLGEKIEIDGDAEINALATSFNTMLSSLDTSREQQQRLVQDASHELRTPLTSMRTNVDLLQRHPMIDDETRQQVLADIGSELGELSELTAELVESATEVPTQLLVSTTIDLHDVAAECVDRARRRHRREISLNPIDETSTTVSGDVALLGRALTNLINNAVKFSDPATPIVVELTGSTLSVLDRGPGIPEDDLPRIFDRFFRATSARSAPGSGLGLSIVKQIVEGHGGAVSASNRADGGAKIGFSLPPGSTDVD